MHGRMVTEDIADVCNAIMLDIDDVDWDYRTNASLPKGHNVNYELDKQLGHGRIRMSRIDLFSKEVNRLQKSEIKRIKKGDVNEAEENE
jgi:hypothetical protein